MPSRNSPLVTGAFMSSSLFIVASSAREQQHEARHRQLRGIAIPAVRNGTTGGRRPGSGRTRALRDELVAEAVDREDVPRVLLVLFELAAQLHDEVVDGARGRRCLDAPDLLEQLVARDGLLGALAQELQDLELVERQALAGAALGHDVLARVDRPGADREGLVGV